MVQCHRFKYSLYADNPQVSASSLGFFPRFQTPTSDCLFGLPVWMFNNHLKRNVSKDELLLLPHSPSRYLVHVLSSPTQLGNFFLPADRPKACEPSLPAPLLLCPTSIRNLCSLISEANPESSHFPHSPLQQATATSPLEASSSF